MSRNFSDPWMKQRLIDVLAADDASNHTKKARKNIPRVVQVISCNDNARMIVINDKSNSCCTFLTRDCYDNLALKFQSDDDSQDQEENDKFSLSRINGTLIKIEDYHFSPVVQCAGNRDVTKASSMGFSLPIAILCKKVTFCGSLGNIAGTPVDLNTDMKAIVTSFNYLQLHERLALKQFPGQKALPNYNGEFDCLHEPYSDSNPLVLSDCMIASADKEILDHIFNYTHSFQINRKVAAAASTNDSNFQVAIRNSSVNSSNSSSSSSSSGKRRASNVSINNASRVNSPSKDFDSPLDTARINDLATQASQFSQSQENDYDRDHEMLQTLITVLPAAQPIQHEQSTVRVTANAIRRSTRQNKSNEVENSMFRTQDDRYDDFQPATQQMSQESMGDLEYLLGTQQQSPLRSSRVQIQTAVATDSTAITTEDSIHSHLGLTVIKEFEGYGYISGEISAFNNGLYRVAYENSDFEDLKEDQLLPIIKKSTPTLHRAAERAALTPMVSINEQIHRAIHSTSEKSYQYKQNIPFAATTATTTTASAYNPNKRLKCTIDLTPTVEEIAFFNKVRKSLFANRC